MHLLYNFSQYPTACINKEGTLGYNSQFISKYVGCREDLFSLIFHELLHPMFQHFIYDNGQLENIAADSVINACIIVASQNNSPPVKSFKRSKYLWTAKRSEK